MALTGKADGSIIIDTAMDTKGVERGVSRIKTQTNGLATSLKKIGGLLVSVFAVRELINFGKEAIELGSNVQEVQNVVNVAFEDMAYMAEEFAASAITNFGMSELAAKKTASTYMAMAKGMGVADEAAADMAITLAGLTGDVASFYNISQEMADIKLKGVFTGEGEALKDLGVVMTDVNLEAYAMEQGFSKAYKNMSQSEKVALRYQFILDKLALANGDFARTQDGWANQTRILSMQWQQFMSIIGSSLITVLAPLVKMLNRIVASLISVARTINSFVTNLFGGGEEATAGTAAGAEEASEAIGESVDNQNALTDSVKGTAKAQKQAIAGFDEIQKLTSASAGGGGGGAGGGEMDMGLGDMTVAANINATIADNGAFAEMENRLDKIRDTFGAVEKEAKIALDKIAIGFRRLKYVMLGVWEDLQSLASPLENWASTDLVDFFATYVRAIGTIFSGLVYDVAMVFEDIWNIALFPMLQKWVTVGLPMVTQFYTQFVATMESLFLAVDGIFDRLWEDAAVPVLKLFRNVWDGLFDGLVEGWNKHGEPIFNKIRKAVDGTQKVLLNIWDKALKPVFDTIIDVASRLWDEHLEPLWRSIVDFVGNLATAALDIYNGFILPVVRWLTDTFGPAWAFVRQVIIEVVGAAFGFVVDKAKIIIDALSGLLTFISGVFTGDWKKAWGGIKDVFKSVINGLIGMAESFVNNFIRGINKIISGLNSLQIKVPEGVPFFGGTNFGFNISPISELTLPRLAQGAVIPPNREFMAVLGDQRSGTNIETPLETMVQAFRAALAEGGGNRGTAYLMVDRTVLGQLVYDLNNAESQRVGVKLVKGGVK